MKTTDFEIIRKFHGSHKAASKALGVSYTRYNEWRWRPHEMPEYARRLIELASEKIRREAA